MRTAIELSRRCYSTLAKASISRVVSICVILLLPSVAFAENMRWEMMDELDSDPAMPPSAPPAPSTSPQTEVLTGRPPQDSLKDFLHAGLSEAELTEILGDPDAIHRDNSEMSNWQYGASSVYLLNGSVTAWSDRGDLAERVRFGDMFRSARPKYVRFEDRWLNAWKKTPSPSKAEAVDELLQSPQQP